MEAIHLDPYEEFTRMKMVNKMIMNIDFIENFKGEVIIELTCDDCADEDDIDDMFQAFVDVACIRVDYDLFAKCQIKLLFLSYRSIDIVEVAKVAIIEKRPNKGVIVRRVQGDEKNEYVWNPWLAP